MIRRAAAAGMLLLVVTSSACDLLVVTPASAAREIEVQLSHVPVGTYGDLQPILDQVNHVRVEIESEAGVRDTVIAGRIDQGGIRLRLQVRPEEARGFVDLRLALSSDDGLLFEAEILDYLFGVAPSLSAELEPVASSIRLERLWDAFAAIGDTFRINAAVLFASGDTLSGVPITWTSETPSIVEVVDGDLLVARGNGTTAVRGVAGQTVRTQATGVAQVPAQLTGLAPADTTITTGSSFQLRPLGVDANGFPLLPNPYVQWSATGGVSVDGQGVVTGEAAGSGVVEVRSGGEVRSVTVFVVDP